MDVDGAASEIGCCDGEAPARAVSGSEGSAGDVVLGQGMGGADGRDSGGLGRDGFGREELGSIANAVMNASTAMTSSQVVPVTVRSEASRPKDWVTRRPEKAGPARVMVAMKVRTSSELPPRRKFAVRWRTARMKAAVSGHPLGANSWMRTCSASAPARAGKTVAASTRIALEAAAAIAPMGRQAHIDNLSHLFPLGVNAESIAAA
jgi:hypothetical protein